MALSYQDIQASRAAARNAKVAAEKRKPTHDNAELDAMLASPIFKDYKPRPNQDAMMRQLDMAGHLMRKSGNLTLTPILPLLLAIKGKPYKLQNHFPFAPFFRTRLPTKIILMTGRQVSKSTSLAAQGLIFSAGIPHFSTLFITPLFEQIRRFSQNYVAKFLDTSPVGQLFCDTSTVSSVLQRSFRNHSQMIFSFAYLDAERTRGISADKNVIDEIQDMDIALLPIIHETISASVDWGLIQYAGTPKTLDNTIEILWQDSSMAEWVIKCPHPGCHHWNIPSLEYDLIDMIGPPHEDISEARPGVCCAKCGKPISPRPVHQGGTGRWIHRRPELRWDFAGYHVPQIVMPMHYAIPEKWQKVIDKRDGKGNTPRNVFFNEVCGQSYDAGAKLITDTDLRRAAILPWRNTLDEARKQIGEYTHRIVAVDWGGGGVTRGKSDWTRQSYTTAAVLGFLPDGRIDVIYGYRSLHPHAHVREAKILLRIMAHFNCSHLAHDYTGAGTVRETVLIHAGVPVKRILPVAYTGPAKGNLIHFKPATNIHPRAHYTMDRNRSLNYCCQFIKSGIIRFFQYDYQNSNEPGLLRDFLSLIEDKSENGTGKDKYKILRDPAGPDDFAHSVNIGSMMLFHMAKHWPDLSNYEDVEVDDATMLSLNEVVMDDWLL
jgi:hypothetical protein